MTTVPTSGAAALVVPAGLSREIRRVSPAALSAVGRKARTHSRDQIQQIKESIKAFGFSVPVLVDENEKIIAGNARVQAALELGMNEVPVVTVSHLNAAQKRAFVLADNKLALAAGWDREVLGIEFQELLDLNLDFSLDLTGFADPEIDALVAGAGTKKTVQPVAPDVTISRRGDLWELGRHRLLCGDATIADEVAILMGGQHARMVFQDPPYNVPIGGHVTSAGAHGEFVMASGEMSDEEFTGFLAEVFARTAASVVPGGLIYTCMDFRHMRHVLDAAEQHRLPLANLIVWDKQVGGMGSHYRSRHELIFLHANGDGPRINRVQLGRHGRDRHNVWCYGGMNGFGEERARAREMHPTVKPLAMVRDAILDATRRSDIVLDLFSGSGTTICAAHDSGRVGYAMELDPVYVDTGILRWQDFSGEEARLAETGQTYREVRAERTNAAMIIPGDLPRARPRTRMRALDV